MWFNHGQKYVMFMDVDKLEDLQKGYKYKKKLMIQTHRVNRFWHVSVTIHLSQMKTIH